MKATTKRSSSLSEGTSGSVGPGRIAQPARRPSSLANAARVYSQDYVRSELGQLQGETFEGFRFVVGERILDRNVAAFNVAQVTQPGLQGLSVGFWRKPNIKAATSYPGAPELRPA